MVAAARDDPSWLILRVVGSWWSFLENYFAWSSKFQKQFLHPDGNWFYKLLKRLVGATLLLPQEWDGAWRYRQQLSKVFQANFFPSISTLSHHEVSPGSSICKVLHHCPAFFCFSWWFLVKSVDTVLSSCINCVHFAFVYYAVVYLSGIHFPCWSETWFKCPFSALSASG